MAARLASVSGADLNSAHDANATSTLPTETTQPRILSVLNGIRLIHPYGVFAPNQRPHTCLTSIPPLTNKELVLKARWGVLK